MENGNDLPWSNWPWNRCKAVREPQGGYWGRCELKRHGPGIPHALERGFHIPRWVTTWTDWPHFRED